jgi:hypothetical protein
MQSVVVRHRRHRSVNSRICLPLPALFHIIPFLGFDFLFCIGFMFLI